MNKMYQSFGYVLAANVEAVVVFVGAFWGARWLDEHYPAQKPWLPACLALALVIIARSWYVMFKNLARKKSESNDGPGT